MKAYYFTYIGGARRTLATPLRCGISELEQGIVYTITEAEDRDRLLADPAKFQRVNKDGSPYIEPTTPVTEETPKAEVKPVKKEEKGDN